MATGGDIIEITYNHPTIGSGVIFAKSAEDSTVNPGGFRSQDDANMITGNGEMINSMNNTRWSVETTVANDANNRKDLENMVALTSDPKDASFVISWINGINYAGTGRPVGDLAANFNKATFTLKLSGGGVLKQI